MPLEGLNDQVINFLEDPHRGRRPQSLAGLAKQAHGERVHGIAGVHGDWNSRAAMHRGDAASPIAAVLNVVVDEKPIVQHFQAGGGRKRIFRPPAQRSRGRDAEGRAQTLA